MSDDSVTVNVDYWTFSSMGAGIMSGFLSSAFQVPKRVFGTQTSRKWVADCVNETLHTYFVSSLTTSLAFMCLWILLYRWRELGDLSKLLFEKVGRVGFQHISDVKVFLSMAPAFSLQLGDHFWLSVVEPFICSHRDTAVTKYYIQLIT